VTNGGHITQLTLLGLLTIALTGGLRFGFDAWVRGSAHSDQLIRTTVVQGLLRRVVGEAYPYFLSTDPTRPYIDFEGTSDSLTFLASAPIVLGDIGRSRFRLSITKHDGLSDLVMTSQAELAAADAPSKVEKKTLLANTAVIEFAAQGRIARDTDAQRGAVGAYPHVGNSMGPTAAVRPTLPSQLPAWNGSYPGTTCRPRPSAGDAISIRGTAALP
jgi:hypothetical protein